MDQKISGKFPGTGSSTRPIYITTSGNPAQITVSDSTSADSLSSSNTNLATVRDIYYGTPTINNSKAYSSDTNYYAPTSVGTSYQLLSASDAGYPIWRDVNSAIYETYALGTASKKYVKFRAYNEDAKFMIQSGVQTVSGSAATDVSITFPRSFKYTPNVVATYFADANTERYYSWIRNITTSGFTCRGYGGFKMLWMAMGV